MFLNYTKCVYFRKKFPLIQEMKLTFMHLIFFFVNIYILNVAIAYRFGHDGSRPMGPRWSSADVVRQISYRKIVMPWNRHCTDRTISVFGVKLDLCVVNSFCTVNSPMTDFVFIYC